MPQAKLTQAEQDTLVQGLESIEASTKRRIVAERSEAIKNLLKEQEVRIIALKNKIKTGQGEL